MAKLSFEKPAAAVTDGVEEKENGTELVPAQQAGPPAVASYSGDVEGEVGATDIIRPRLTLVQKTSELCRTAPDEPGFDAGDWVVNKDTKIGSYKNPVNFVCIHGQKLWQEFLPYGTDAIPQLFRSAAEAREAGLSTERMTSGPRADEIFRCLLWFHQPEGVDAPHLFTLEGPEGFGAVVAYTASRTNYSSFGKTILTAAYAGHLVPARGGLVAGWWELQARLQKRENNSWFQAGAKPVGPTSEELRKFLSELAA